MTEQMIMEGPTRLSGRVTIDGAKNAVLPIQAAALLASSGTNVITNVPLLSDVYLMNKVLEHLGVVVDFDEANNRVTFDASGELSMEAPFEYVSKMRASVVVMGPLLARFGKVRVAMPGGCAIGSRPIDLHTKGFEALGATIETSHGYVEAHADHLVGTHIYLDFPSVGATENIMMAATLAEGTTVLENVAREPEIVDLANFLNKMGAKVSGAGTDEIHVEGVEALHGTEHAVIPDRIEAGTFMIAAAITRGDVYIEDAIAEHNLPLISKLREAGAEVIDQKTAIHVRGPKELKAVDVKTLPYPGFPTDLQAPFTVLQTLANGTSRMRETVFENRFMHLEELRRMNAQFAISGDLATIEGLTPLQGTVVTATDLRAAAALILAGLVAEGTTKVNHLDYLDRGYHRIEDKLRHLGAKIGRVTVETKDGPGEQQTAN